MQDGQIQETTAEVVKVGDELVVRLPKGAAERLALKEGDQVELRTTVTEGAAARAAEIDEIFDRVRLMRRKLPAGYKFDRDEANSRGRDDAE